jgi:hypothetical protein
VNTKYEVIREVVRNEFGFNIIEGELLEENEKGEPVLREDPGSIVAPMGGTTWLAVNAPSEDWDIMWFDFAVYPKFLKAMKSY